MKLKKNVSCNVGLASRFLANIAVPALVLLATATFTEAGQGPQPSICNRTCWGAVAPSCGMSQMGTLNRAIIHHTGGATSEYTTDLNTAKALCRSIQSYSMNVNGMCDMPYHFLVDGGGHIFEGRSGSMTSLTRGAHDGCNNDSFGFSCMGLFTAGNNTPSGAMLDSLYDVIAWRMPSAWSPFGSSTYCSQNVGFLDGHRKVLATACPGDNIYNPYITDNRSGGDARNGVNARKNDQGGGGGAPQNRVGMARTANGGGYWIVASDGGVFSFGNAVFYGSMGGQTLNSPVVGMAARPQGDGYWLVASDGGIFSFGAAGFHGSMGGTPLNQPIVGMSSTASGGGYWMVAKDGGIFSFGDAPFHGSLGGSGYTDITCMASTPANGYWIMRSNGSIYSYGANYYGGGGPASGAVGLAPKSDGTGYWELKNTGQVYTYGVNYYGGANDGALPFKAITRGPSNAGYWLLKKDGAVFSFGNAAYHGGANY